MKCISPERKGAVWKSLYAATSSYIQRCTGRQNAEEAEDAVSDAVLTAYEKRNQLKDKERFEAWILNKNHSTIRSKYRRALQKMKDKLEV